MSGAPGRPIPVPAGCVITDATVVGLTMTSPERLEPGALVDFDLILGARPIATMARVIACGEDPSASGRHRVDLGFVAMAQVDRDTLADFLQAVGRDVLRVREPRR